MDGRVAPDAGRNHRPRVCVAIPTYRRPALLAELLDGLAGQTLSRSAADVEVAVFDNDPARSAEAVAKARSERGSQCVHYIAVPEPGLSVVRNAALSFALQRFDYLAMIDDDEVPEPQWLHELMSVCAELDADAVIGPVPTILPESAPSWIVRGAFFALPMHVDRSLLREGYTGNCLLRLSTIWVFQLRFDADCNLAGGEDQLFFRQLSARGGRIAYAAAAVAWERVLPERLCALYLLTRHLRRGNSLWICDAKVDGTFSTLSMRVAKGVARVVAGSLLLVPRTALGGGAGLVGSLCDIARGVGMLAGFLGITVLGYRRKPAADERVVAVSSMGGGRAFE